MFKDRVSAGKQLAVALDKFRSENLLVVGIPRGGVVVAIEVAKALGAGLDLIIPRKIGAPGNQELAIGAVAGEGQVIINPELVAALNVPQDYIDRQEKREVEEIQRRRRLYLGNEAASDVAGKTVLLVDDGLATGYTALAGIRALRMRGPEKIVLAVPVAPKETLMKMRPEADEIVCLSVPEPFFAVGQFYEAFGQVSDGEVVAALEDFRSKF